MASANLRIGLFGGSFDPPHVGHLIIAEHARVQLRLDRVIFIPASTPPHKNKKSTAMPAHRVRMTKLAVRGNTTFTVSDVEIQRGGVSFTIDTVKEYRRRYPRAKFFLIIGSDNYNEFSTWKAHREILRQVSLVVYPRKGHRNQRPTASSKTKVHMLRGTLLDISSSSIRSAVQRKQLIRYLMPDSVSKYIDSKKLYRK